VSDALPPGTAHLIALASLDGVGPATLARCLADPGPEAAWAALVAGRPSSSPALAEVALRRGSERTAELVGEARALDPAVELDRHLAGGRRVLVRGEPGYPERLRHDPAPPALLFAIGDLAALDGPTVAVVGTRNATRPGTVLAAELGAGLAEAGVAVVSGLALGIDGAAHRGALAAAGAGSGAPVGVIASGLDIAYPRRHAELHAAVAAAGLLLSETPLGRRPSSWRFPARNRIIAGLADAVVVVESRSAGGSMLTVTEALDRGVTVLAVPGHPTAPAAAGTNDLLSEGAGMCRTVADVLVAIGSASPVGPPGPSGGAATTPLPPDELAVLAALAEGPAAFPEVVGRTGLAIDAVATALAHLEGQGLVSRAGSWYEGSGRHLPDGRPR
jgi:DNA processing protein